MSVKATQIRNYVTSFPHPAMSESSAAGFAGGSPGSMSTTHFEQRPHAGYGDAPLTDDHWAYRTMNLFGRQGEQSSPQAKLNWRFAFVVTPTRGGEIMYLRHGRSQHCQYPNKIALAHIWRICDQRAVSQASEIKKTLRNMAGKHTHLFLHSNTYHTCMGSMGWHVCVDDETWTDHELSAPISRDARQRRARSLTVTINNNMPENIIYCFNAHHMKQVMWPNGTVYECQGDMVTIII